MKAIIILILSFLLFSYSISAEEKEGTLTAPDKNVEIEVLKERINGNKEITTVQLNALDEKINNQQIMLTDKIASKSKSLVERMNIYLGFAMGLLAIIGFIGFKTISRWIRQTIESKTDEEIKKYVTLDYIKNLLKEKGEDSVNVLLAEAKEKLSALDYRFAELDKLENEYKNSLADLKDKPIDTSKPLPEETIEKLEQFEQKVAQVKTEGNYSFDDWFYKGISEFDKEGYANAIESFTNALEKEPKSANIYFWRGLVYNGLRQYEKAIEDTNKAIELDPKFANAYSSRGLAYSCINQYKKAIEGHNKAIELDPRGANYSYRGITHWKYKQYEKAIEDHNKAIELDPKDSLAHNYRGFAHYFNKQYEKAMEDYNKAIELDPESNFAYKNLAEFNIVFDNYESALENIKKALSLQPTIKHKAIILHYEFIAKKLLGMDTAKCEAAFNEIIKKDFALHWNFDMLESWLKDVDIDDDTRAFIKEKTELLKQKQ